jgi:dihydropyrimidinase
VSADMLHDNVGYTPYEGRQIIGWPVTVISRGRVVVADGELHVERGSGTFLPCASPSSAQPLERPAAEIARLGEFGDAAIF